MAEQSRLEIPGASVVRLAGKGDDGAEQATVAVLEEIAAERRRQESQWGGPSAEDGRLVSAWVGELCQLAIEALAPPFSRARYRHRLLQAAAVCVAAIEALDRRVEQEYDGWGR